MVVSQASLRGGDVDRCFYSRGDPQHYASDVAVEHIIVYWFSISVDGPAEGGGSGGWTGRSRQQRRLGRQKA